MRYELTESAKSWFRTVKGWKISTVKLVKVSIIGLHEPELVVEWHGKQWRMGSGCLKNYHSRSQHRER